MVVRVLVAQRAKAEVARTDVARAEDATTYQMWRQCQGCPHLFTHSPVLHQALKTSARHHLSLTA